MEKIKAELLALKRKKIFEHKYIVAIGRIEHIRKLQELLEPCKLKLDAIVDNDKKKHGISVNGVIVYAPEELLLPFCEDRLILVYSPKYWQEILSQFEKMGYVEGRHIIILQKPTLVNNIREIIDGYKLYKNIQNEFGKKVTVFVCSCPLGDFYLLSLYFRQYIELNNITDYVIVGNSKGLQKLSELFGYQNTRLLRSEQTELLIKLYVFMGNALNLKILTIWQGALRFNPCIVRQSGSFTFMDTFKYFVYKLNESAEAEIPQFDALSKKHISRYEKMGLIKGQTVILAPFSYSMQSLPVSFWQKLSDILRGMGYCVAINIDEKIEDNPIKWTKTIDVSLRESVCALEYAGAIIGIRSGFFDVTSSADCKRIVLYPEKVEAVGAYSWNCTDMDFNSLNRMGLCNDAIELEFPICGKDGKPYVHNDEYDENQTRYLIDMIIKEF